MYTVRFYRDSKGNEPVGDYIRKLYSEKSKDSRINPEKINDYIEALSIYGISLGEPYIKHLKGKIWELRPLRNRILFFGYDGSSFVLLSHFIKKTQKTPQKEIDKAEKLMKDYIARCNNNE